MIQFWRFMYFKNAFGAERHRAAEHSIGTDRGGAEPFPRIQTGKAWRVLANGKAQRAATKGIWKLALFQNDVDFLNGAASYDKREFY
jgi:hypothetical protein